MTVSWWGLAINLAIVALLFWWWRRARDERIRAEEERRREADEERSAEDEALPGGDPEAWERALRVRETDAGGAEQRDGEVVGSGPAGSREEEDERAGPPDRAGAG